MQAETALAVWVMVPVLVTVTEFAMPSFAPKKKEGHVVKFTFTASVCGCAYEWVCMLARAACDWLGLVSEKVAQHIDNHVVLFMSLQKQMRIVPQGDHTVALLA